MFYNLVVVLDSIKRKNAKKLAQRSCFATFESTLFNIETNNALQCTSCEFDFYYKHIETIRKNVSEHNEIDFSYIYKQLFRFLQTTNKQTNILVLYIRDLNKTTKIVVSKAQRELYLQTIICSSDIMYVKNIRINYL